MRARPAVTQQVQYHGKHTPDTPIGALIPDQQHNPGKLNNLIKFLDFYTNMKMYTLLHRLNKFEFSF